MIRARVNEIGQEVTERHTAPPEGGAVQLDGRGNDRGRRPGAGTAHRDARSVGADNAVTASMAEPRGRTPATPDTVARVEP